MRDKTIFSISCIINENSTQESAGCRGIREKWYFFKRFFALFLCKDSYDDQANVIRKYMKDVVKGGGGGGAPPLYLAKAKLRAVSRLLKNLL